MFVLLLELLAEEFELASDQARVGIQFRRLGLLLDGVLEIALGEVDASQGVVKAPLLGLQLDRLLRTLQGLSKSPSVLPISQANWL